MTTVSGLTKETVYTVEVAAETSGGTGVYSEPFIIETPESECVIFFCIILDNFPQQMSTSV